MIVCPELSHEPHEPRTHPWTHSSFEEGGSYYDFKCSPHLISEVLEDFRAYASYKAIQTFYEYLRWINGTDSKLESNDCAFRGPSENQDIDLSSKQLRCCGRVEIFYRYLPFNVLPSTIDWLIKRLFVELCTLNPAFIDGFIEVGTRPTLYLALRNTKAEYNGQRIYLHFCSYGDNPDEAFNSLHQLFKGLFLACKNINQKYAKALLTTAI